jgi:UDP-N-acetylglucosamine acyltransferase
MPIDPSAVIASTAVVSPEAEIGPAVRIGEYCIVEPCVTIGAHCVLEPYVYVKRYTTLGERNEVGAGTVLGTDPLDKNFAGTRSYLTIGSGNKIREHFTISRGTPAESATVIGDGNFIMTSGHIAHNCIIGNNTVIASCVLLGGYVHIEDQAFLSGGVLVHQFTRVGRLAMVSGNTRVNQDAPPFFTYSGFEIKPRGLNLVGLKRAGLQPDQIRLLKQAYRWLYREGLKLGDALARIDSEIATPEAVHLAAFIRASRRGIARG